MGLVLVIRFLVALFSIFAVFVVWAHNPFGGYVSHSIIEKPVFEVEKISGPHTDENYDCKGGRYMQLASEMRRMDSIQEKKRPINRALFGNPIQDQAQREELLEDLKELNEQENEAKEKARKNRLLYERNCRELRYVKKEKVSIPFYDWQSKNPILPSLRRLGKVIYIEMFGLFVFGVVAAVILKPNKEKR